MNDPIYSLPPRADSGDAHVVIETPKGSRNKLTYDPERRLFRMKKVLPAGMSFPFDFGFVPSTIGGDGDPIDVLVLMDAPTYPGVLVEARLVGVIEAQQRERDGRVQRNDRLIAVARVSRAHQRVRTLDDVPQETVDEIEHFFVSYNAAAGKEFRPTGRQGPERAAALLDEAAARHGDGQGA